MSESLEFSRRGQADYARNVGGYAAQSHRFAIVTIAAGNERRVTGEELGHYSVTRLPLQNALGQFYFTPGYDVPGDPAHPPR